MLDLIEKMKRGGLWFVGSKRHVKANEHYLDNYDKTKPETYLMYWDANNLYGWAMIQLLAYRNLKFNTRISIEAILNTADDNIIGYSVEVTFIYPKELHDNFLSFNLRPRRYALHRNEAEHYEAK